MLPQNVDRIRDGSGYRYVAYAKDGFAVRLSGAAGHWQARAVLTGAYVGSAATIAEIANKVAAYQVRETYAQSLANRVAGCSAWDHTDFERRNIIRSRSNQHGTRLAFADYSAAFIPKGTAAVCVVA